MLCSLAALLLTPYVATVEIYPSDDVWAYPHAADADQDPFLRVWGFEGQSLAKTAEESESLGYSFLRFDLAGLPDKKLKGAELVLTHSPKPAFTLEQAQKHPLEVWRSGSVFDEKTWQYSNLAKVMPSGQKRDLFGAGAPATVEAEKEFPIRIDLMKDESRFASAFAEAQKGAFALALASTLSPAEGARSVYKVYSRNGPKEFRPVLRLTFED